MLKDGIDNGEDTAKKWLSVLAMSIQDLERLARVRELIASGEAKRLRVAADVSLSEVAAACGVDTSSVWRWETGRRSPRGSDALQYARVLAMLASSSRGRAS